MNRISQHFLFEKVKIDFWIMYYIRSEQKDNDLCIKYANSSVKMTSMELHSSLLLMWKVFKRGTFTCCYGNHTLHRMALEACLGGFHGYSTG